MSLSINGIMLVWNKKAQQINLLVAISAFNYYNCYANYYLSLQYLSFTVDSRFGWNKHRWQWPVQESVRLTFDICLLNAVTQLLQIQFCLDVDMLSALDRIGCLYSHLLLLLGSTLCRSTTPCFLLALKLHWIWSCALWLITHHYDVIRPHCNCCEKSNYRPGTHWGSSRRSPRPPNRLGRGTPPPQSPPRQHLESRAFGSQLLCPPPPPPPRCKILATPVWEANSFIHS